MNFVVQEQAKPYRVWIYFTVLNILLSGHATFINWLARVSFLENVALVELTIGGVMLIMLATFAIWAENIWHALLKREKREQAQQIRVVTNIRHQGATFFTASHAMWHTPLSNNLCSGPGTKHIYSILWHHTGDEMFVDTTWENYASGCRATELSACKYSLAGEVCTKFPGCGKHAGAVFQSKCSFYFFQG